MFKLILVVFVALCAFERSNALTCGIVQVFSNPGDFSIGTQSQGGFCNDWVIGPVVQPQMFLIKFSKTDLFCSLGDKLVIYNEDRNSVLFDMCNPVPNQQTSYAIITGKYVYLRLSTTTSFSLSVLFSFYLVGTPSPTTTTTSATKLTTTTASLTTTTAPSSAADCGIPYFTPRDSALRIVGGVEAVPNSWPWQAFLTDGSFMCGASLINNQWLVTASHCLESVSASSLKVYLGVHNINNMESTTQMRTVARVIKHPSYIGRSNLWDNDIALLKLTSPVTFTNQVKPVCLPNQGENLAVNGAQGYVSGWGKQSGSGPTSNVLKQTTLNVQSLPTCGVSSTQANMICAGQSLPVHDSCGGDSGGPFVIKKNNNYVLTGVVSWGSNDCIGDGIYTKVSNYVDWIKNTIATN